MPLNVFIQVLDYKLQNYKSFKSNQHKTYDNHLRLCTTKATTITNFKING